MAAEPANGERGRRHNVERPRNVNTPERAARHVRGRSQPPGDEPLGRPGPSAHRKAPQPREQVRVRRALPSLSRFRAPSPAVRPSVRGTRPGAGRAAPRAHSPGRAPRPAMPRRQRALRSPRDPPARESRPPPPAIKRASASGTWRAAFGSSGSAFPPLRRRPARAQAGCAGDTPRTAPRRPGRSSGNKDPDSSTPGQPPRGPFPTCAPRSPGRTQRMHLWIPRAVSYTGLKLVLPE